MNAQEKMQAHAAGATEVDGVKYSAPTGQIKPSYKIAIAVALTCDNPQASYPEQVEAAMAMAFNTLHQVPAEPGRTDTMEFDEGATTLEVTCGPVQTVFRVVPAYQQRVLDEQLELQRKLDALQAFIGERPAIEGVPSRFDNLAPAERTDLKEQCTAMWNYNVVLLRRIKGFSIPKPAPVAEPDFLAGKQACDIAGDFPCEACQ